MGGHLVVTGVAGFIGSHLAEALLAQGHHLVGIDAVTPSYPPAEKRANISRLIGQHGFRFVEGDLTQLDLDGWLKGATAVFHLAAQPGIRSSWGDEFTVYLHHNVLATQRLLEACARERVPKLILASSSSVYGNASSYPTTESALPSPISPYGVTKLSSEQLCVAYARREVSPMSLVVLRYFTVYGPRQRPDMGLRRFLEAVYQGRPVTVFGDGEQTRDFTFVSDAVRAGLLALEAPLRVATINVSGACRVTLNRVIELVSEETGRHVEVVRAPPQDGEVRHTEGDGTLASQLLGYRPSLSIEDGLAAEAAWVAARGGY